MYDYGDKYIYLVYTGSDPRLFAVEHIALVLDSTFTLSTSMHCIINPDELLLVHTACFLPFTIIMLHSACLLLQANFFNTVVE